MDETMSTTASPASLEKEVKHERFAGFWMRFWAYLVDIIVVASLNGILITPMIRGFDLPANEPAYLPLQAILTGIVYYAYFILMTKFLSQTLGKMLFGLRVASVKSTTLTWGTVIFREGIGRFISKTILFVGFLVVAFTKKKQGIHDLFADTIVVHEE
ncbi:RDD family protein [Guptibacillus hwajinpoensis]|uniref:RDD family protein n=1 Tax=Guptibacillus hwajinpoensis TaxID=208199 RepID=UPI001CFCDC60|nr:RDD family protein [Pseudalkalibacillus hwajinpoensis]WLR60839.1 RDD family protein [Pseudalkalibacillus hwajinpoensis]